MYWNSTSNNIFLMRDYSGRSRINSRNTIEWMESRDSSYWLSTDAESILEELRRISSSDVLGISNGGDSEPKLPQSAVRLLRIRSRLAFLTNQPPYQVWDGEIRDMAARLKGSLQRAGRLLTSGSFFGQESPNIKSIVWSAACHSQNWPMDSHMSSTQLFCFHMFRPDLGDDWNIDEHHLEAVLGLWLWSFQKWSSQQQRKLPTGIKPFPINPSTNDTLTILLHRWGTRPHMEKLGMPLEELTDLSVPAIMLLQPLKHMNSVSGKIQADVLSVDSRSSVLNLMAQDIFSLFMKSLALTLESGLVDILYPDLAGKTGPQTSFIEGLIEILVLERLATRDEAVMSIVSGLYQDSAFQRSGPPLHLRLISKSNSLKRQTKFEESELLIQRLVASGSKSVRALAQQSLCELYRSELRWKSNNSLMFTTSEIRSRAEMMCKRLEEFNNDTDNAYRTAIDMLLARSAGKDDTCYHPFYHRFGNVELGPPIGRRLDEPQIPLDMKTLASLNLDNMEKPRKSLAALYVLALTLVDKYDLGASDLHVRKQLLRWAIETDCHGLVEDLWISEQHLSDNMKAFGKGTDEIFWAVFSLARNESAMATILFLLDVTQGPVTTQLQQKDQMNEPWWSTSALQETIKTGYERYDCPLSVASSDLGGLEYVQLLAGSRNWGLERLHAAVLSALDSGSLETVKYLYSKTWVWEKIGMDSQTALPKLLETASRWGLKTCVRVVLAGEKRRGLRRFGVGDFETALKAAREGLSEENMERGKYILHYDQPGVIPLLEEAIEKLQRWISFQDSMRWV
jgi:hypothetical protein